MQTTLLGIAIAFILALVAALIGPYFVDWSRFRPQFEAEATHVIGLPVRVDGAIDARLLPTPSLRLRGVSVGARYDESNAKVAQLDIEFSLGSLMRGDWRADELTLNGLAVDLGLDDTGRMEWAARPGMFNFGALTVDRLNVTGTLALKDAASRSLVTFDDVAFRRALSLVINLDRTRRVARSPVFRRCGCARQPRCAQLPRSRTTVFPTTRCAIALDEWIRVAQSDERDIARKGPAADAQGDLMEKLWKLPAALVEMTVGTVIVMYQLTVARRIVRQEQKRLTN